nr:hypothetical protein [Fodinicola feengrottensis]
MLAGGPSSRTAPVTSRNASSTLNCSTIGVTSAKIAITSRDTSPYAPWLTGRKTALGQSRRATPVGMALRTPKARAS